MLWPMLSMLRVRLVSLHDKFMRVSDIAIIFIFSSIPGPIWVPGSLYVHVAFVVLLTLQSSCIQKSLLHAKKNAHAKICMQYQHM